MGQLINIPFSGTLKEGEDARLVQAPNFTGVRNVSYDKQTTVRRRFGFDRVTNTVAINNVRGGLSLTAAMASGNTKKLAVFKDELLAFDGDYVYSLIKDSANSAGYAWSRVDRATMVASTRSAKAAFSGKFHSGSKALVTSTAGTVYEIYVYLGATTNTLTGTEYYLVYASVRDYATGATLLTQRLDPPGAFAWADYELVKVAAGTGHICGVFFEKLVGGVPTIYGHVFDADSPSTGFTSAPGTLASTAVSTSRFDVVADNSASTLFTLVYCGNDIVARIELVQFNSVFTPLFTAKLAENAMAVDVRSLAIIYGSDTTHGNMYWVAWNVLAGTSQTYLQCINTSLIAIGGLTKTLVLNQGNIGGITANNRYLLGLCQNAVGSTKCTVVHTQGVVVPTETIAVPPASAPAGNTAVNHFTDWCQYDTATNALYLSQRTGYGVRLASFPFPYNGKIYCQVAWWAVTQNPLGFSPILRQPQFQGSHYLAELDINNTSSYADSAGNSLSLQPRPVAMVAPRLTNELANSAMITSAWQTYVVPRVWPIDTLHFTSTVPTYPTGDKAIGQLFSTLYDFSSITQACKGVGLGDHLYLSGGMVQCFDGTRCAEAGFAWWPEFSNLTFLGAGPVKVGNVKYKFVFEYRWASGYIERSAPVEYDMLLAVDDTPTFTFEGLQFTTKQELVDGQYPYVNLVVYRNKSSVGGDVLYEVSRLPVNITTSQGISYTDTIGESALVGKPFIYTTPDILDNVCPPGCTDIVAFKNRIWCIGEDQRTVWFTKALTAQTPQEAPAFNEALAFGVQDDGQPLVAIAAMDSSLILFKRRNIYYVTGEGPTDNGQGYSLSQPQPLNVDVGCIEPRSVVRTNAGIMFLTDTGLYMLDRGLGLTWVGKDIQTTLDTYPTILSACLDADTSTVYFLATTTETSGVNVILTYNYTYQRWGVNTILEGARSLAVHNGTLCILFSSGVLYRENKSVFIDGTGTTGNQFYVETAWVAPAGPQGFTRIEKAQLLFETLSPDFGITIEMARDFGAYNTEEVWTWSAAELAVAGGEVCFEPKIQECQAARFRITTTDSGTPTTRQGAALTSLVLDVTNHPGPNRLQPAAQK